jgi:hypothetical protein
MTPDLVEKVARAIWENREGTFPGFTRLSWEDGTELARTCARADARAALRVVREVMAESDEAMRQAGYRDMPFAPPGRTIVACGTWRRMLAASPLGRVE